MQEKDWFVIESDSAKQVLLTDIIKEDKRPALIEAIEDALRNLRELKSYESLMEGGFFENSISLSENFFLAAGGLGFHWDPYEIAPYAVGPIEVILPYEKIKDSLTEKGQALIREIP
jgi:hypothetical protein